MEVKDRHGSIQCRMSRSILSSISRRKLEISHRDLIGLADDWIDDWIGMNGDNNDEGSRPSISRRISCGIDSFKNQSAICIATVVRLVDSSSHTSDSCASVSLSLSHFNPNQSFSHVRLAQ